MSEDGRFCTHHGVDWQEMGKVLDDSDGPSRGASTIPMQTVKNLFLWTSRSYIRKAFEIPLAFYADAIWTKRRTMEIYLNVVEWGPNVFGAEAAARHYFKRSAKTLSLQQAALSPAGLPPAPSRRATISGASIPDVRTGWSSAVRFCIRRPLNKLPKVKSWPFPSEKPRA
jgi:monofunctional biosynthetic peptidoglycan transglycosylase